jgi:hypothetical protein
MPARGTKEERDGRGEGADNNKSEGCGPFFFTVPVPPAQSVVVASTESTGLVSKQLTSTTRSASVKYICITRPQGVHSPHATHGVMVHGGCCRLGCLVKHTAQNKVRAHRLAKALWCRSWD